MRWRLVLASFALVGLGVACGGSDADDAGRLTVDGQAEVASPGADPKVVRGSTAVKFGQRVKVLEGTAVLKLDRDRELELRAGSNVVLQEAREGDRRVAQPLLLEADMLVQAPPGARLTVSTEGADVIVSGDAQVTRGPVLVVSSYGGAVELRSGDRMATVPALRQVSIPAGGAVPDRPSPLSYDSGDAWDRRFLSDAIELGNELEARSKGFSAQVSAADGSAASFLVRLLPELAAHPEVATTLFNPKLAPGESLVGAAIVLEGTQGTFTERWAGVFDFRGEGAQWGLVALDQGVTRAPLLAAVDGAIGRGPRPFEPIPLDGSSESALPGAPPVGGGGSNPSGGAPPTTVPGPARTTVPVPTTVAPTATEPGPGPINTGISVVDATINALVATLSGLLQGLSGG